MAGEDGRTGAARGGETGRRSDRLHVSADHSLRIGPAARCLERNAINDIAAIGGQRLASVRLGLGTSRLGELASNASDFDERPVYGWLDLRRHVVEQADNTGNLLGNRVIETLGAVPALQKETASPSEPGRGLSQLQGIFDRDDRSGAVQPRFD